jgi:ribosomal protein S18 acetylase RimI-like enzyme
MREIAAGPGDRECFYVALDESGELVGISAAGPTEHGQFAEAPEKTGEIFALYVLPAYQGRGHGRRLVEATARHLAQSGLTALIIRCLKTNPPGRAFYEALGGRLVGEVAWEEHGFTGQEVVYLWPDTRALIGAESAGSEPGEGMSDAPTR